MPEIGRFTGVDPIADQYSHVSVYNYAENSPIGNIDLWGLQAVNATSGYWSQFKSGVKEGMKSAAAFTMSAGNAIASNHAFGIGRGNPNDFGDNATAASYGQMAGDAISVLMGGNEMISGGNMAIGGVVAEGATLGLSTVAVVGGTALAAEGFSTASSGLNNLLNPTKVEAKSNKNDTKRIESIKQRQNDVKHTSSKSSATSDKHTKVRPGERTGDNKNANRGSKNQKYKQSPNPNKRIKND